MPISYVTFLYIVLLAFTMEGLRITGQTLFSDQDNETIKHKIASILSANGSEVMAWERTITGESTLNTYEVNLFPGDKGSRIEVNYGMSTLGIILTLIFLVLGGIIGIIILVLWYMKMDDIKSELKHAYPGYMPPQQQKAYSEGQATQYNNPPPPQQSQKEQSQQRSENQSENKEWNN